jgi:hypothetical protein
MSFKRVMVLGAVASALAFAGCQSRRGGDDTAPSGAGDTTQPATGGSGNIDSTIPGSSNTMGGVRQDERPGTELGGTGGAGGSINDQDSSGSLDQSGIGGSGTKGKTSKKGTMGAGDAGTPGGTDAGM